MPCYRPFKAFATFDKVTGRRGLTGNPAKAINSTNPMTLPCGQCIGCRIDRSRDWAMRCHHEAQMHEANSFITLTYADEQLPSDYSVNVRVFQLFMKRLRKELGSTRVRFFACGEYGDLNLRPHYHALIFGYDFRSTREIWKRVKRGNQPESVLYRSSQLERLWPYGFSTIGQVNYQTAAYTARYIMKKISGDLASDHYQRVHPFTLQPVTVQPEFCLQSRRPGIGASWFAKFKTDAFPSDFLIVDGRRHSIPRYYSLKLQEEELTRVKRARKRRALPRKSNNTKERLAVREAVASSRISQLKREL